jgi:ribonuclease P protein component
MADTSGQGRQISTSKVAIRQQKRLRHGQRLHHPKDFQRVYDAKNVLRAPNVVVFFAPNGLPVSRLGVSVSVKHGNAVRRNRIKRVFRAAFRLCQHRLPASLDFVLVPRAGVKDYNTADVEKSLLGMLNRLPMRDARPPGISPKIPG